MSNNLNEMNKEQLIESVLLSNISGGSYRQCIWNDSCIGGCNQCGCGPDICGGGGPFCSETTY